MALVFFVALVGKSEIVCICLDNLMDMVYRSSVMIRIGKEGPIQLCYSFQLRGFLLYLPGSENSSAEA